MTAADTQRFGRYSQGFALQSVAHISSSPADQYHVQPEHGGRPIVVVWHRETDQSTSLQGQLSANNLTAPDIVPVVRNSVCLKIRGRLSEQDVERPAAALQPPQREADIALPNG